MAKRVPKRVPKQGVRVQLVWSSVRVCLSEERELACEKRALLLRRALRIAGIGTRVTKERRTRCLLTPTPFPHSLPPIPPPSTLHPLPSTLHPEP